MNEKYKVHVAVGQFEFVETECTSAEEAKLAYDEIRRSFSDNYGMDKKNLCRVMDKYLTENVIELPDVEAMGNTPVYSQRDMFNCIKMSLARIKRRETDTASE